jgi:hypothetical protein
MEGDSFKNWVESEKSKTLQELYSEHVLAEPLPGWVCSCGHYQEDNFHCSKCGNEPPWGCDCCYCEDRYLEAAPEDEIDFAIFNPEFMGI